MYLTCIVKKIKLEEHHLYFFKDMSVEKQLYDKYKQQLIDLKNSHDQIIQSDKLKIIGEMTANISHEINNPLTVVMGNAEMISFSLDNADLNPLKNDLAKFTNNINLSVNRIMKIIANMKEFLHKNEDAKEYVSVRDILKSSLMFLSPSIKKNKVDVKIISPENDLIIYVNKIKIEQVIVNLIQNALDALFDNQTVEPKIEIVVKSDHNGHIKIDIIDNGPGIKAEDREKIFTTFFTTKEVGKGTGLGLSIANRILEAHQGKLELLNAEQGACFQITLPSVAISNYVNGDWEKIYNDSSSLKKILVVDNEAPILNLCLSYLKNTDFYFLGATSPAEAFEQLKRIDIDLIITDIKMPGMSGVEFVEQLRSNGIMTPVFYMTAKSSMDKFQESKNKLNISGIIIKPFTKDEFINSIETVMYAKK
jgi:nitrogen-specific signal transduction histidine kinase